MALLYRLEANEASFGANAPGRLAGEQCNEMSRGNALYESVASELGDWHFRKAT